MKKDLLFVSGMVLASEGCGDQFEIGKWSVFKEGFNIGSMGGADDQDNGLGFV